MRRIRSMAKNKTKNRKSSKLIFLFIPIFIVLIYLIINNCKIIDNKRTTNKQLTTELSIIKNQKNEELQKEKALINTLEEINNIDTNIKKTKEEVFKLAKELENKIINNETNYKIAYITFDDGPYYSTNKVLDILKQYQVKATFFTIGLDKDNCYDSRSNSCKETYKKIVDNGHTIANHTYSHSIFRGLYTNSSNFINDVKKQEQLIESRTGYKTNILRFPGGINTAKALMSYNEVNKTLQELKNNNYGWIDWTAQDGDGGYLPSYSTAWNNFTKTINENIEVILFHDYSYITISMLPKAIEYLQENNYIILPLFYESIKVNK